MFKEFAKNQDGNALPEYVILWAGLAMAFVIGAQTLSPHVNNTFCTAGNSLGTAQAPCVAANSVNNTNNAPALLPAPLGQGNGYVSISNGEASSLTNATAQQIASATGGNGSNGGLNTLSIWGDPHISTDVAGNETDTTTSSSDSDYATIQNTEGGATSIATDVVGTGADVSGAGIQASGYSVHAFTISAPGFTLETVDTSLNNIQTVMTDSAGNIMVLWPNTSYDLADGAVLSIAGNGGITLVQNLSSGGIMVSTITQDSFNGADFLDLVNDSTSDLVLSGTVANQITGDPQESAVLL